MKKREKFLKRTKEKMTEALRSRDVFIARMSRTIEEINEVLNLLGERLEEMVRLYYPKLEIKDREKYALLLSHLDKNGVEMKKISKIFGSGKANEIAKQMNEKDINGEDLEKCKELSNEILSIYSLKKGFEEYEEKLCSEECPNLSHVGGPHLAAKLIAHVGSLGKLAMLPASTIQVIGAEKALFKHLRNKKVKPPKHGIIFQHARVSNSPKKIRGRIARTLAAKLSSAAKADAFTKNFIAEKLKKEFDKRYETLMEGYKRDKK